MIRTHSFTAMVEAADVVVKVAKVGFEKIEGRYVTVMVRGDLAACRAAVDAKTSSSVLLNSGQKSSSYY
ncbi:MAG: BMC domain-containing protein [Spirochaetes bacterium]|nr:BMC domain-containing protein [Spirochaetota bacterium]